MGRTGTDRSLGVSFHGRYGVDVGSDTRSIDVGPGETRRRSGVAGVGGPTRGRTGVVGVTHVESLSSHCTSYLVVYK